MSIIHVTLATDYFAANGVLYRKSGTKATTEVPEYLRNSLPSTAVIQERKIEDPGEADNPFRPQALSELGKTEAASKIPDEVLIKDMIRRGLLPEDYQKGLPIQATPPSSEPGGLNASDPEPATADPEPDLAAPRKRVVARRKKAAE